ncbi:probable cytochrome P450 49a1 [Colias croceus]|uniref:probable cytochrome P450 49a1 n=1 Tax=Colias crocea TaxID=72248 RepID=UPI001E27FA70|nr:probable cytochrome P450 49a1 [Colias croceus]
MACIVLQTTATNRPRKGRKLRMSRHRRLSTSSPRRTSTSPQRHNANAVAPSVNQAANKRFSDIPGPIALPVMKHHEHVLPRIGCFHHAVGLGLLDGLKEKYGSLVRLAKASRKRPVLYVFDPELMREVYNSNATEPPAWVGSPLEVQRKKSECPMHRNESNAIWSALHIILQDGTLLKSYEKAFDDISEDAIRRLGELRHAGNALNEELLTEVYRWALETIGVMIFGMRLGCLNGAVHVPSEDNRRPEKTSMDDDIKDLCSLSQRSIDDLTAAEQLVRCSLEIADENYLVRSETTLRPDTQGFKDAVKNFDRHFCLTEHFLAEAQRNLNSGDLKPEQILLDKLKPLGDKMLPLAADVFLAGVDPLAQTALNMFYQLSLHAAQQQRAHDEITWSKASKDAGVETHELPYISACVREALRLKPVTGGVVRRSVEEFVVDGYEVPAGVDIVLAHGVSSKTEQEWGRAKSFIPERWCNEGWAPIKASRAHPFASLPFGQSCPASGIISHMLSALATRMLDKYRLEWHGPQPKLVTSGVNKLQKPYYFVLQNAS